MFLYNASQKHNVCQIASRLARPIAVLGFLTLPVCAETACVRCTGPDATYRCIATSEQPLASGAAGFFCASKIAGEHAHESCAVQRGATDCQGLEVSYAYDETSPLGAIEEGGNGNDDGEPSTLGEFTKDTVSTSAKTVKKAGENIGDAASKAGSATANAIKGAGSAIGNATKKTWKCLGSALNDC